MEINGFEKVKLKNVGLYGTIDGIENWGCGGIYIYINGSHDKWWCWAGLD